MIKQCVALVLGWLAVTSGATAQEFSGLARVDAQASIVRDAGRGIEIDLRLSQGVPYRVFTLTDPKRLVVDFREVDWSGFDPADIDQAKRVRALRVGGFRPGWSRMVADLEGPFGLTETQLQIAQDGTGAQLVLRLGPVAEAEFAARAGAPEGGDWGAVRDSVAVSERRPDAALRIVLDPGHGGIDPGAAGAGVFEKDLMLRFARELKETLLRGANGGIEVILTREDDSFVSLERRVAIAHEVEADLFLSLHADSLSEGLAHGATVYALSDSASDAASAKLAERHNRADMLAGVDLTGKDDVVADVLMDLARMETQPRADRLARAMVLAVGQAALPLNKRPMRRAGFSVLKAPDIPSILLEVGFMSSPRDLENLRDPAWRARMAQALSDGISAWDIADRAARDLVRQ